MLIIPLQGMSGTWRNQLSLRTKVQIPHNCKIDIILRSSFPAVNDTFISKQLSSRFADLTDLDFFLEPLDSSLFPGIPSDVECHSGFANEQAMYVALVALGTSHANDVNARKDRIDNPFRCQKYALVARSLGGRRGRPFSRWGARPPRWRLLEPTDPQCDGECDHLWHAACREPSIRQFRR